MTINFLSIVIFTIISLGGGKFWEILGKSYLHISGFRIAKQPGLNFQLILGMEL